MEEEYKVWTEKELDDFLESNFMEGSGFAESLKKFIVGSKCSLKAESIEQLREGEWHTGILTIKISLYDD